ncbi:hypothetical protein PACTADRAFT_51518 [Pachysolen tannophilus NRRL Y-2460]|uniref:RhoGAP-domain-containing protein n=1 Tax=Pachysolen tannophilus NRRL Y-2460 TaxID=669874 RepID=A0A1E4TPW5_PACTA|nr:hypothetical protein PACTADRAFT_51518 [Pachysolen tannophilus NRRL Y-2460]
MSHRAPARAYPNQISPSRNDGVFEAHSTPNINQQASPQRSFRNLSNNSPLKTNDYSPRANVTGHQRQRSNLSMEQKTDWRALIAPMPDLPGSYPSLTPRMNNRDFNNTSARPSPRINNQDQQNKDKLQMTPVKNQQFIKSSPSTVNNENINQHQNQHQHSGYQGQTTTTLTTSATSSTSPSYNKNLQTTVRIPLPPPVYKQNATNSRNEIINNNINNNNNNNLSKKPIKYCKSCGQQLSGQFVRALGDVYHVSCFRCYECGKECASKFFSSEIKDPITGVEGTKIALCEYDYFKKLDLICYKCNNALRGPYVTALNRKYHLEHFTCSVCDKVFETDESFYEHEEGIYCHFHFSKLYASHCEGCHSSILKQFVEVYRGGREQQWHPECYMVHKFWNISITANCIGLSSAEVSKLMLPNGTFKNLAEIDLEPSILFEIERKMEKSIVTVWLTLSGFEESTAACISNMLQYATTGNPLKGLLATGKLILKVECLFNGIDALHSLGIEKLQDKDSKIQNLKKEPRSLSAKIMTYLALLRKSTQAGINADNKFSQDLLSLVTGLAHYLKLMIRYGLHHALLYNKSVHTTIASERFFGKVSVHESVADDIFEHLEVPANSTDACSFCDNSIEQECVQFKDRRWHLDCFFCSNCQKQLSNSTIQEASYIYDDDKILCSQCSTDDLKGERGFKNITKLSQLIYLLKIALVRSKVIMQKQLQIETPDQLSYEISDHKNINETQDSADQGYKQTLSDIRRMRSKRQDQKLSGSVKQKARRSRIIEAPEGDSVQSEFILDESTNGGLNKTSSPRLGKGGNANSPEGSKLRVEDEPFNPKNSIVNLDRTSDLLKNEKSLTLDDIPRIVAAEQAREQRPNAFRHHNSARSNYPKPKSIKLRNSVGNIDKSNSNGKSLHKEKKVYYSELNATEHFILRHIAVLSLNEILKNKFNRDELLLLIPIKKPSNFWTKIFGSKNHDHSSSSISRKGSSSSTNSSGSRVFGVALEELASKYAVDSDLGVGPAKLRIPIMVDECISALHQMDMSVEGVFRKNGNIKGLRVLTEAVDANPSKMPDFTNETPIQLAALLKKFLRELPDPLLTFKLYEIWILSQKYTQDAKTKNEILKLAYCMLPKPNRDLVEVLLYFFRWVASFSHIDEETGSKMDIHNLATVITPNILYLKHSNSNGGTNSSNGTNGSGSFNSPNVDYAVPNGENHFLAIEVVDHLLEKHDEFCVVPPHLYKFYLDCGFKQLPNVDELTTKEILTKCELFLKNHPDYFNCALKNEEFKETNSSNEDLNNGSDKIQRVNPQNNEELTGETIIE